MSLVGLINWAKSSGFYISDKLDFVVKENEGSTVVALDEIGSDERLIECPREFIIGPELAKQVFGQFSSDDEQIYIKFAFLYEFLLGEKSKWYPYLSVLPTPDEIISPFYFQDEDLDWLQGTNIAQELDTKRGVWEEQYSRVIGRVGGGGGGGGGGGYTLPLYIWCNLIFLSRSFPGHIFDSNVDSSISVLVPIIDSLNHQPLTPIHWDCSKGTGFNLLSGQVINKGQEVFNNYGAKGNEELFIGYGFTIEDNIFDIVSLRVPENLMKMMDTNLKLPKDGVFHLTRERIPGNLKTVFQVIISLQRGISDTTLCTVIGLEELCKALQQKRKGLNDITDKPQNIKQTFAKHYREGQIYIYNKSILECQEEIERLLTTSKDKIIDIERLQITDERFIQTVMSALGLTIDEILQYEMEDQILMIYISNLIINKEIPELQVESEDLTYYEELCANFIPLFKNHKEFNTDKWTPLIFLIAGGYLQTYGYNYMDREGRDRYRCIINVD